MNHLNMWQGDKNKQTLPISCCMIKAFKITVPAALLMTFTIKLFLYLEASEIMFKNVNIEHEMAKKNKSIMHDEINQ